MSAADKGHAAVARALIAKGADVKAVNHEKKDALAFAEHGQHADVIAVLKKKA
jgi:hypothetical protein